ncbi:MAG: hypothetical protein ACT4PX_01875 [Actinomycetota bacterium]
MEHVRVGRIVVIALLAAAAVGATLAGALDRIDEDGQGLDLARGSVVLRRLAPSGDGVVGVGYVDDRAVTTGVWRRDADRWVALGSPAPMAELHDALAAGDRILAVGTDGGTPAVWSRSHRGAWRTEVALDPAAAGLDFGSLVAVAEHAGTIVAAGTLTGDGRQQLVAAVSVDGAPWRTVPIADGWIVVGAVRHVGGEFMVVGGSNGAQGVRPAVWRSADGLSWTPDTTVAPDARRPGADHGWIQDVVATADGGALAVGMWSHRPTTWTSTGDGWRPGGDLPTTAAGFSVRRVISPGPDRFLAVGTVIEVGGDQRGVTWTSADGRIWSATLVDEADYDGIADALVVGGRTVLLANTLAGRRAEPVLLDPLA